jgi:hypothetical protein
LAGPHAPAPLAWLRGPNSNAPPAAAPNDPDAWAFVAVPLAVAEAIEALACRWVGSTKRTTRTATLLPLSKFPTCNCIGVFFFSCLP